MGRLAGRIAVVTGASRGIGRAVAKRFAAEGAEVVCIARTQGALEELDDEISAQGGKAILCPLNLREVDKIDHIAAALFERFGRLDILVGNAGSLGGGLAPVGHIDQKHFLEAFETNVTANYHLIRALDPLLRQSPAGRAMFVTDPAAHGAAPFWGVYTASKAALETLVKTWAAEVARITEMKINLIAPAPVATRLRASAFPGEDQAALLQPDAITDTFVDLASEDCRRHGEIVPIG